MKFLDNYLLNMAFVVTVLSIITPGGRAEYSIDTSTDHLFLLGHDKDFEPYQIVPEDLTALKSKIVLPGGGEQFFYKIFFKAKEDIQLVYKEEPQDLEYVMINDGILFLNKGDTISMGTTPPVDDLGEDKVEDIVTAAMAVGVTTPIGKLGFHKFTQDKTTAYELNKDANSNGRVMTYMKKNVNANYYLNFDTVLNMDYKTMAEKYMHWLNDLLHSKISAKYVLMLKRMNGNNILGTGLFSNPIDKVISAVDKMVKNYKENFTNSSHLLMATLKEYYDNEVLAKINGQKIGELLVEALLKKKRNLVLEATIESLDVVVNDMTLKSPWHLKEMVYDPCYVQLKMKEILIDMAGKAMISLLVEEGGNGLEVEGENDDFVTLEEKKKSFNPTHKLDVQLAAIIGLMHEDMIKEVPDKLVVPNQVEFDEITKGFVEAANFDTFIVKLIMEHSKEALPNFISKYVDLTIERTKIDENYFNLDKNRKIDLPHFKKLVDIFGIETKDEHSDILYSVFVEGGTKQAPKQVEVEVDPMADKNTLTVPDKVPEINSDLDEIDMDFKERKRGLMVV